MYYIDDMYMSRVLIVFTRNLLEGKVKTRIAKKLGDETALAVYRHLLENTMKLTSAINADIQVAVYYSEFIEKVDQWPAKIRKERQKGDDLGMRMGNAMSHELSQNAKQVCIIGCDVLNLSENMIHTAFSLLKSYDVVIGPASDGGYYLLGMNNFHNGLFERLKWGTNTVLNDTIHRIESLGMSYVLLPELNDVDEVQDIPDAIIYKIKQIPNDDETH